MITYLQNSKPAEFCSNIVKNSCSLFSSIFWRMCWNTYTKMHYETELRSRHEAKSYLLFALLNTGELRVQAPASRQPTKSESNGHLSPPFF